MRKKVVGLPAIAIGIFSLTLGMSASKIATAQAVKQYWIDESTDFTGNGCENFDLNDVTSQLQTRMNTNSWTGSRYVNVNAWPQDFRDSSIVSGGIEGSAADSQTLSIHAGHGNVALLGWGYMRNSTCVASMPTQTRLGTLSGNSSGYGMYLDSCVMRLTQLGQVQDQEVYQQFGYNNSPDIYDDQPANFFDDTATVRNDQAWLERMDDRPGIFAGWNSPVALTFAQSSAQCTTFQTSAKLKAGVLVGTASEPWSNSCWIYRDNGSGPC